MAAEHRMLEGAARFRLSRASTAGELRVAGALRERVFRERRQLTFDEAVEARRDRTGHVFLLYEQGTPIAVGRVLPYPSPVSDLVDLSHAAGAQRADSEIGRVACVPSLATPRCAVRLLTLGSFWLLEHTRLRRYVAYCQPRLVPMYRALGATPCAELRLAQRSEPYWLISGSYEEAAARGARRLRLDPNTGAER